MNWMKRTIAIISAIGLTFSGIPVNASEITENKPEIVNDSVNTPQAMATETSGRCGLFANWEYQSGTLTISGKGRMNLYRSLDAVPWKNFRDEIRNVVIEENS